MKKVMTKKYNFRLYFFCTHSLHYLIHSPPLNSFLLFHSHFTQFLFSSPIYSFMLIIIPSFLIVSSFFILSFITISSILCIFSSFFLLYSMILFSPSHLHSFYFSIPYYLIVSSKFFLPHSSLHLSISTSLLSSFHPDSVTYIAFLSFSLSLLQSLFFLLYKIQTQRIYMW